MKHAQEYHDEDILVLLPEYRIRPNANHCILYPFDVEKYASWRRISFLEGIALTLLDGKRNLKQVVEDLAFLFDIQPPEGKHIIESLIQLSRLEEDKAFLGILEQETTNFSTYPTEKFVSKLKGRAIKGKPFDHRLDVPLSLLIMPSNKCVVDCIYCYAERREIQTREMLSINRWIELIDEAADLGIDIVVFSGGDPMTYPHIELLFERMVARGIKFLVPTKSYISKEHAERLANTGMKNFATIQVSIDGVSSAIDQMMGITGYADKALETIGNLTEKGFFIRTNTVCTPINVYEIPQLVRALKQKGVERTSITNYGRSYYRHQDALFLNQDQIEWAQAEVAKLKQELGWEGLRCNIGSRDFSILEAKDKEQSWRNRSHCSGGQSSMTISPDGKVILCEQVPQKEPFVVNDAKTASLLQIWHSESLKNFIHPSKDLFGSTVCKDCEEFDDCHKTFGRCFRDALFTFGSVYAPSPNCPRAPKGLRMS